MNDTIMALSAVLSEVEDALADPDHPIAYVGLDAAHDRLTADCEEPALRRLEYAPHHVSLTVNDEGELEPDGHNELLDSPWDETVKYRCVGCDTFLEGHGVALAHAHGIDLSGLTED